MQDSDERQTAMNATLGSAAVLASNFATAAANIFGSDIYLRVGTLQFWDSNQVAHAMMGFAGTTLTSLAFVWCCGPDYRCYGLLFMILPIWRDVIDYLIDAQEFDPQFSRPFLHKGEVLRDCVTDSSFWFCGSLLALTAQLAAAGASPANSYAFAWFCVATGLTVWHGISHYKPQKQRFDRSAIPYFVRLAKIKPRFLASADATAASDKAKLAARDAIARFLDPDEPCHLLLIAGGDDSGKTTLACAMATEFAVSPRHRNALDVRYILMGELYSMARRERGRYGTSGVVSDTRPISAAAADILFVDEAELTPHQLEKFDPQTKPGHADPASDVSTADALKFLLLGKKRIALIVHSDRVGEWTSWLATNLYAETPVPTIWIEGITDDSSLQPSNTAKLLAVGLFAVLFVALGWWLTALLYTPPAH